MLKKGSPENLQSALGNSLGCKVSLWSPGKGGVSGTRSLEFSQKEPGDLAGLVLPQAGTLHTVMTLCPGEITCHWADPIHSGARVSCKGLTLRWLPES